MWRMNKQNYHHKQRGDTIVEVLIAIAIVSLVLTSAYVISNKNSQTMQAVQEKTQAQKLVERQIELIKAADRSTITDVGSPFCFTGDTPDSATASAGDSCAFNGSGDTSPADTGSVQYKVTITIPSANRYTVAATWDRLGGGTGNITMYYYEEK